MRLKILRRLGLKWGDFVQIQHCEFDTLIIRQLIKVQCRESLLADMIYVDGDALKLLGADLCDTVRVDVSDYGMPFP